MALSNSTIETVKATVPALKKHGSQIILEFYDILFKRYPAVKGYFNMDRQRGGKTTEDGLPSQVASLAGAVLAYAQHIDNISAILPVVEGICHKHVSRGVEAPQYDAVGECLIAAIKKVLGAAATEDIVTAWTEAYGFLANTFISIEKDLRAQLAEKAGFDGMVDMTVVSKDDENGFIGFVPVDHKVPEYSSDQFVSIAIGGTMTTMKLVKMNPEQLTIHITRKEEKATMLLIAASKGDVLKVSMPCGKQSIN